jgi:AcrR family transcriptional regulator
MNTMSSEKPRRYELKARAESQAETRARIVQATMELHQEVGPARTTVTEIARRAGVQRLTVYNHFPQEAELFGACQAHWMTLHPLPDLTAALTVSDPAERVRTALGALYGWYRETRPMAEKVQRDRGAVAALDQLMQETSDAGLAQIAAALAAGFGDPGRGRAARCRRAMIGLALEFWTWRRLDREGLDDHAAAEVMAEAVAGAGSTRVRSRPGKIS